MPSRVLVHQPPPAPPELAAPPPRRPARGEEFPPGWTVADYNLVPGDFRGEEYDYEVWVVPLLDDTPRSLAELRSVLARENRSRKPDVH